MGQGGYIILYNGTRYTWKRTYIDSHQMNNWDFPNEIASFSVERMYIEWEGFWKFWKSDAGDVTFELDHSDMNFKIEARERKGRFNLTVRLTNIATPQGSDFDLGWNHDGAVIFYLVERNGKLSGPGFEAHWMSDNISLFGDRTLKHLCIPGSHDAGMSENSIGGTAFGHPCNTQTQTKNIFKQLEYGARYFDIRPVISAGQFYTGHYGHIRGSYQGANGQSIDSIIQQVNEFTNTHNELIILLLSHDLNTDLGYDSYQRFNQGDWDRLFDKLSGIKHRFMVDHSTEIDLTTFKLNQFIGQGKAAVIIVVDSDRNLGRYENKGFYKKHENFDVYNEYANTNDLRKMMDDQFKKMRYKRHNPDYSYFLLSWTLTQSDWEATTCSILLGDSILKLANKANRNLHEILDKCTPDTYPNIIFIDNEDSALCAEIAIGVNIQAEQPQSEGME